MTELKHLPVELTDTQRSNLTRLADYLAKGKTKHQFDMRDYYEESPCGTVACAAGHGPAAGVRMMKAEDWVEYVDRVFGESVAQWYWCFCDCWGSTDNTPQGAAARIRYMLENGVPENYDEQMCGDEPLSYEVTA